MLGLSVKQRMATFFPNSLQPYCFTKYSRIISSVFPCKGLLGCSKLLQSPLLLLDKHLRIYTG